MILIHSLITHIVVVEKKVAVDSSTLINVLLVSFWLTSGLFMMFLALLAYSSVLSVSCAHTHTHTFTVT